MLCFQSFATINPIDFTEPAYLTKLKS